MLTACIWFKIGRNLVGFCHHDYDIADSIKWPSFFQELNNIHLLKKGLNELVQAAMRSVYPAGVFSNFIEVIPLGLLPQVHTDSPQDNIAALLLLLLLLLLLVLSPWAGLGRDQSSVRRLVWLWYAASWASS